MQSFRVRTACAIALWLWSALCWAVTLEWTTPTHNTDGSVLTDLAGYRIHYGNAPGELTQALQVTGNSHEFDSLDERKPWYFAVRAYTEAGAESDLSNIVRWVALPGAPSNLRVTWAEASRVATVVQTAVGAFSGTSAVATFASPVTAGNAIIVLRTSFEVDENESARTYTVSDNKGGANANYVAIGNQYIDPLYTPLWTHQIRGIANSAGGSGTAVTVTSSEDEAGLILVAEISGLGSSLTVDGAQVNTSGSGTAVAGAAKTPSAAGIHLVLVGALSMSPPAVTAAGSGWTLVGGGTSAEFRLALLHRAAANGVSQSAAATLGASPDGWGLIHVVLSDAVGGGGGVEIDAGVDALAITEQAATVSLSREIAAGTDALSLTEQTAQIKLSKAVAAGLDTLSLSGQAASLSLAVDIPAGTESLTLTPQPASIAVSKAIDAGAASLDLSGQAAGVSAGMSIGAQLALLTTGAQIATVTLAKTVSATAQAIATATLDAVVTLTKLVLADVASLSLTGHQATVVGETVVTSGGSGVAAFIAMRWRKLFD